MKSDRMLRFKLGEIVGRKVLKPVVSFPDASPADALTPPSFWEIPLAVDLRRRVVSFSTSQYPCLPHEIGFAAEAASLSCCSTRYMALVRYRYRAPTRYFLAGKIVPSISPKVFRYNFVQRKYRYLDWRRCLRKLSVLWALLNLEPLSCNW